MQSWNESCVLQLLLAWGSSYALEMPIVLESWVTEPLFWLVERWELQPEMVRVVFLFPLPNHHSYLLAAICLAALSPVDRLWGSLSWKDLLWLRFSRSNKALVQLHEFQGGPVCCFLDHLGTCLPSVCMEGFDVLLIHNAEANCLVGEEIQGEHEQPHGAAQEQTHRSAGCPLGLSFGSVGFSHVSGVFHSLCCCRPTCHACGSTSLFSLWPISPKIRQCWSPKSLAELSSFPEHGVEFVPAAPRKAEMRQALGNWASCSS